MHDDNEGTKVQNSLHIQPFVIKLSEAMANYNTTQHLHACMSLTALSC